MVSLRDKIIKLNALVGEDEYSDWEDTFITSVQKYKDDTTRMTEKQLTVVERIYSEYFQ